MVNLMSAKTRAGVAHLWRGVRTGLVVLAANPAVQSLLHGNKAAVTSVLAGVVAAAVAADSVYEGRKTAQAAQAAAIQFTDTAGGGLVR
jgi:hypothetical protein